MEKANAINCYTCEACGGKMVTVNEVAGVTPFMIKCRGKAGCDGMASSACYGTDQNARPDWEWYRPQGEELDGMIDEMKEHVKNGGLVLRKLDGVGREKYGWKVRA